MYFIRWGGMLLVFRQNNMHLDTGNDPAEFTEQNINTFPPQIKALGFSYDWDREINTTDPDYYKWTQWIFLKLI